MHPKVCLPPHSVRMTSWIAQRCGLKATCCCWRERAWQGGDPRETAVLESNSWSVKESSEAPCFLKLFPLLPCLFLLETRYKPANHARSSLCRDSFRGR
ncbi:rCG33143 [Rattus norvegicus]|uniref:RCG33143 n=1 Tax=Rattus norvegicus TaxID=10116 RepID=A6HIY1_RAT|nr:rCG33143 [Rattus norvegicus]